MNLPRSVVPPAGDVDVPTGGKPAERCSIAQGPIEFNPKRIGSVDAFRRVMTHRFRRPPEKRRTAQILRDVCIRIAHGSGTLGPIERLAEALVVAVKNRIEIGDNVL